MFENFKNIVELLDHFHDQETCLKFIEKIRWDGEIKCAHCGCDKVYRTNRGFLCRSTACGKKFSVLVGTIFENTKLPLRTWYAVIFLNATSKKGISAKQVSAQLNISLKAAWFMLHRIREGYKTATPQQLSGTVAIDETFVGGKNINRHHNKKVKNSTGRVFIDKTPVLGMIEYGGRVACFSVKDTSADSLMPMVKRYVRINSTVYTDEWKAYSNLYENYNHYTVDHGRGQYVSKNGVTTNLIECFWSTFKKGLKGIYCWVSRQHMQRYCNEFMFRYNHRELDVMGRFRAALQCAVSFRLSYQELVK